MTKKKIFEGKAEISKTWAGTSIQTKSYKDKFGTVKKGESRCCHIDTAWGQLSIPTYKDINKYGNKQIKIIVELEEVKLRNTVLGYCEILKKSFGEIKVKQYYTAYGI